jgi:hypothetical protein
MVKAHLHFLLARACKSLSLPPFFSLPLPLPLSLYPSFSLSLSPSLSLTSEQGVHALLTGQRDIKRGRKREREREREVEYVFQLSRIVIYIFKRNDRCLGTF